MRLIGDFKDKGTKRHQGRGGEQNVFGVVDEVSKAARQLRLILEKKRNWVAKRSGFFIESNNWITSASLIAFVPAPRGFRFRYSGQGLFPINRPSIHRLGRPTRSNPLSYNPMSLR
jgi:hypothetical protein